MSNSQTAVAVFGGGCFWCVEAVYQQLQGVLEVSPGYAGGSSPAPTYEQVCSGRSGHIEVVTIRYDPALISYAQLLDVFFATHNPTTPERQGADVGPQYSSVIFWQDPEQAAAAKQTIETLTAEQTFADPIVTQLLPGDTVWPAEDYHRNYYAKHPQQGYCQLVIAPKLSHLRARFSALLRATPGG